jgi:hypothetical protein
VATSGGASGFRCSAITFVALSVFIVVATVATILMESSSDAALIVRIVRGVLLLSGPIVFGCRTGYKLCRCVCNDDAAAEPSALSWRLIAKGFVVVYVLTIALVVFSTMIERCGRCELTRGNDAAVLQWSAYGVVFAMMLSLIAFCLVGCVSYTEKPWQRAADRVRPASPYLRHDAGVMMTSV